MVVIKAHRRRRVDLHDCGEFTKQDMAEINEKTKVSSAYVQQCRDRVTAREASVFRHAVGQSSAVLDEYAQRQSGNWGPVSMENLVQKKLSL
jgi:hypothetical protein